MLFVVPRNHLRAAHAAPGGCAGHTDRATATAQPIALNLGGQADVTPTVEVTGNQNCVAGQIELSEPQNGTEVTGVITLKGIINVEDFGFYKYEYSHPAAAPG